MRILRRQSLLAFGLSLFCTFTAASPLDFDTKSHLAVPGDFNGDGRMDVLMQPLVGDGKGAIILQDGTGQLSVLAQGWDTGYLGLDWSTQTSTLTTADLNADGQDDVLMQPVKAGGTAAVLITDPTIQLLQISQLLPAGYLNLDWSSETHHAVAGDFDGDRHKELFMQATGPGGLGAIVHADQMGNIVAITQTFADGYLGRHWNGKDETLYVGDFNGDGRQDLLVQSKGTIAGESAYALLLADGNGQFTRISQTWNLKDLGANWNPATHKVIIQDANHDGIMDIVLQSTASGGTNYLFEGNAQGLFMQPAAHWTGTQTASDALAAANSSKTGTTKTSSTGIKTGSIGGMSANTINAPTNPEQNPTLPRGPGGGYGQGSGQIMTVNAAGALQGSGGVSGGTATYSIPISVPPGIAGMQPSISLNYSSRGGNGEMGMGWSVSAGSQIHRCPATYAMDGYASGVTYSSYDALCLDGQHLIYVNGGRAGYGTDGAVYRTELDSFSRITESGDATSGTSSFSVVEKSGHTRRYGYGSNIGASPNTVFIASGATRPLAWGLGMEVDTYNNSIIYYYSTFGAGEYLLTSIKYTGSGATAGNREVDFSYSTRGDVTTQYLAGGFTTQSQILNNISVSDNGTPVHVYTAEYTASGATNRSLLAGVQECGFTGSAESCLPETTFSWQNAATAFSAPVQVDTDPDFSVSSPSAIIISASGDFDGDGRKDIVYDLPNVQSTVYFLNSDGSVKNQVDITNLWGANGDTLSNGAADVNDDGAADLFGFIQGSGGAQWFAYSTYNGSSFNSVINLHIPASYTVQGYGYSSFVELADVNGDGLVDLVALQPDPNNAGNHALVAYLNQPTSCSGQNCPTGISQTPTVLFSVPDYTDTVNDVHVLQVKPVGDLDGNGLPDYEVDYYDASGTWHQGWVFTQVNKQDTLAAPFAEVEKSTAGIAALALDTRTNPHLMDINGDGLADMVYDCSLSNHDWCYQLNKGGTFSTPVDTGVYDGLDPGTTVTADLDNDGVQQLVYPTSTMIAEYCQFRTNVLEEGARVSGYACANPSDSDYGWTLTSSQDISVYKYARYKFMPQADSTVEDHSGYRYVPQYATTGIIAQSHMAVAMDVYGDGLTGIVSPFTIASFESKLTSVGGASFPRGPSIAANSAGSGSSVNAAPDLMLTATDGFGRSAQWDYFPLSSSKRFNSMALYYSPGVDGNGYAGGDYFYFASSMYVVGDYSASDGVGGLNTHDFHYGQAIYNNQGRGFQGFRIVVDDDMTNSTLGAAARARTVQVYHQRFPLSGELVESWTTSQADSVDLTNQNPVRGANAIDDVTYQWGCIQGSQTTITVDLISCGGATMDAHTYVPVLLGSTETHYDVVSHDQLSQTSTQYCAVTSGACAGFGYDLYANSLGSVTTVTDTYGADADSRTGVVSQQGTYTTSISNSYPNLEPANWWLDKLSQKVTTTAAVYGSATPGPVTRTTNYDYYETTRGLNHVYAQEDGQTANESTTQYTYSGGNVTSVAVTGGTGAGAISRTTATAYSTGADSGYFVQTVTDPQGLVTSYAMDSRFGLPTTVTAPDGANTYSSYDAFGRKITSQLGSLPVQTISYITADSTCAGTSTTSQYYVLVNQTGYPSHYACYDMFNRAIRTAHENLSDASDLVVQSTYYDNHGRVTKFTEPHFSSAGWIWNTNQYDDSNILGRLSSKMDAKGITTSYAYNDLVTEVTTTPPDSAPRQDEEVKNSLGKLMTVTNAVGAAEQAATSYQYDADGNPVTVTAADNTQITAVFDVLGHKTSVTDPDQGTTQYSYDVAGDLVSQTDAKSQTLTMTYDNDGRMLTKSSSVSTEPAVAWTYDSATGCAHGAGKVCTVAVADGSYSEAYAYTALGMVKSDIETIGGTPYETDTAYDSDGRVALVTFPSSITDQAPVANAGSTQYVLPGATVTLSGSGTTDPDNGPDPLGYQWSQTVGPAVSLSSASVVSPSFTAGTALGTTYSFQLIADDGMLTSTANVNVVVPNAPATPTSLTDDGDTNHDGIYAVSWQSVSVTGTNIVYHLEEATGTASGPTGSWSECYVGSAVSTSINHSGNSFYYYWYRVRAEDQISGTTIAYSGYSSTDSIHVVVKPGAPSSISPGTGTSTTGTYTISWGAATGGVVTADVYYQLYQSTSSTLSGASQVYSGTARSQSITNSLGDYYYEVRACNTNASVSECSAFELKAHEIVESTSGGGGSSGGGTQPQFKTPVIPVPPPVTNTGTGSLVPVSPILPQLQSGEQSETASIGHATGMRERSNGQAGSLHGPAREAGSVAGELVASTSQNAFGHMRPKFAPPVYKAWADAKVQNATTTAQVVRFSVQYIYSGNGYLYQLADGTNPNRVYWWVNNFADPSGTPDSAGEVVEHGMNAYGQVTDVVFGSSGTAGPQTHYAYDGTTDYLDSIKSTTNGGATVYQNLAYTWQTIGNLATRASNGTTSNSNVLSEGFTYDLHNRLLSSTITNSSGIQPAVTYGYDSVGDMKCRSDLNGGTCSSASTNYGYGASAGPHAVTSIVGTVNGVSNPTYTYDADGNRTGGAGTAISWNSDNLPTSIIQSGSNSSTFSYAPDKHRYMQVAMNAGVQETTIYAGGMEIFMTGGVTKYRHTLSAYGRPVFLDELSNNSAGAPKEGQNYLLTDHLGSVDTVIDAAGVNSPQLQSFDTFGHHRDPNTWLPTSGNGTTITKRGFTHHEHMDNVGLIHMNGRVYDPVVARFLSVDPVYQAPTNSQSVNPYSYVMNNPLSLTDPSGYASACPGDSSNDQSACADNNSVSSTQKTSATDIGSHVAHHGDTTTTTTFDKSGHVTGQTTTGNGAGLGEKAEISADNDNGATHGMTGTTMPNGSNAGGSGNQGASTQRDNASTSAGSGPANTGAGGVPTATDKPVAPSDKKKDVSSDKNGLTYIVIGQGKIKTTGGVYDYVTVKWQLTDASKEGGWIVQHIRTNEGDIHDYWEAWHVSAGAKSADNLGNAYDDDFIGPKGTTISAEARFYEGLTLPKSFGHLEQSALLPATPTDPKLPNNNATDPVDRIWNND